MAEPGITQTDVLKLNKPDKGYFDWDVPLNENWDKLDQLGAGQLPLLTPLEINYKLSGDALLGWALQGSFVDADIYTSLWDMVWAARQRAGEPNQALELLGATYYISRDSVTGLYFTTADSYARSLAGCGSSLGMICEYNAASGTKTLRLRCDDWDGKPITDYEASGGYDIPGYYVPESLPNITGAYAHSTNAETRDIAGSAVGAFFVNANETGMKNSSKANDAGAVMRFSASRCSSAYQDGARVRQRSHAVYRYYKIGNTIQNQGMIDVGALTEAVSDLETGISRINTIMDSNDYKYIAFPNTARISDITSSRASWTAPAYGWLRFTYTSGSMNTANAWINGQLMMSCDWQNNWNAGNGYLTWPMNPGDKFTSSGLNAGRLTFWYAKTAG